jgi:hypothetical protein
MDLKQLLEALIEANARHGAGPVVVYVVYPDGSAELLTLPASVPVDRQPTQTGQVCPELSEREKAALGVVAKAEHPLKGRTVATRAGLRYTSHFREMMSGLVQKGLVQVGPEGGYWPAGKPLPRAGD